MPKLRVESLTLSLDGFGAGPDQDINHPLAVGGTSLHAGTWPHERLPVFVLTHHARAPLVMEGGTTFHLGTEGIDAALAQAREAAGGKDVRPGGGVKVIQQRVRQRLIDELHIAISPVLLGAGERRCEGINLPALGDACTRHESSPLATHLVLARPGVR